MQKIVKNTQKKILDNYAFIIVKNNLKKTFKKYYIINSKNYTPYPGYVGAKICVSESVSIDDVCRISRNRIRIFHNTGLNSEYPIVKLFRKRIFNENFDFCKNRNFGQTNAMFLLKREISNILVWGVL